MDVNGTTYHGETNGKIINALESARQHNKKIRVWYGHTDGEDAGLSWDEENDTIGTVGRSTGTHKIPLLIKTKRSFGGGALSDNCIIKIYNLTDKRIMYQHPNFRQAVFTFTGTEVHRQGGNVKGPGPELYARCKSIAQAQKLSRFMNGEIHAR